MANPISTSIKGQLKSAAISTVSDKISSKVPKVNSQMISAALGGSDLKSAALGSFSSLGGAVSEAVSGAAGLLGSAQAKLGALNANAEELVGLANNPLKLIEKGKADLMGITGEEYGFTLDQYRELKDRSALPLDSVASAASKLPNPLRNHNGMNYEITLGVLSAAEFNNPESYRAGGGFKSYIIKHTA